MRWNSRKDWIASLQPQDRIGFESGWKNEDGETIYAGIPLDVEKVETLTISAYDHHTGKIIESKSKKFTTYDRLTGEKNSYTQDDLMAASGLGPMGHPFMAQ